MLTVGAGGCCTGGARGRHRHPQDGRAHRHGLRHWRVGRRQYARKSSAITLKGSARVDETRAQYGQLYQVRGTPQNALCAIPPQQCRR